MNYYQKILDRVKEYQAQSISEKKSKKKIIHFILNNQKNIGRENSAGHLTASAWIVNNERDKVLLHQHLSLNKWIQLGGHLEADETVKEAALREAREESGLDSLAFLYKNIFDIDHHLIPVNNNQAEHFHYDIRYLLEADSKEELEKSRESVNLKWLEFNEVEKYVSEESVLRMLRKTKEYKED